MSMTSISYAASWTELCNRALGRLGVGEITDLAEGTQNARFCLAYLGDAIEDILGRYDWSCCRKREILSPDAEKPLFGWKHRFPLPEACIRVISVYPRKPDPPSGAVPRSGDEAAPRAEAPYTVENGYILADEEAVDLLYIERPKDPNRLGPAVRKAVYTTLAFLLSTPLTSNEQIAARIAQEMSLAVGQAMVADAQGNYDPGEPGEPYYHGARA
jgi:hypothetical protein